MEGGQCANCGFRQLPPETATVSQQNLGFAETPLKQRPGSGGGAPGAVEQAKVTHGTRTGDKPPRVRPQDESGLPLFQSQSDNEPGESPAPSQATNPNPVVFEKPLIRRDKDQKPAEGPNAYTDRTAFDKETAAGEETEMSREILFSRLLAGLGDLSLSASMAVLFIGSAAWVLQFDVFSPLSIRWLALLALAFYFFNSIFFLLVAGQSPGMSFTHLVLVDADGDEVSTQAVLLRVILFLPAMASVVGLLWGVIDPKCRCLHDHLSGTRIVPGPK